MSDKSKMRSDVEKGQPPEGVALLVEKNFGPEPKIGVDLDIIKKREVNSPIEK